MRTGERSTRNDEWFLLCGDTEGQWQVFGPFPSVEFCEADRDLADCGHGHHFRRGPLPAGVEVSPPVFLSFPPADPWRVYRDHYERMALAS